LSLGFSPHHRNVPYLSLAGSQLACQGGTHSTSLGLLLGGGAEKEGEDKEPAHEEKDNEADLALVGNGTRGVLAHEEAVEELLEAVPPPGTGDLLLQSLGYTPTQEKGGAVVLGGRLLELLEEVHPSLGTRLRHLGVLLLQAGLQGLPIHFALLFHDKILKHR